MTQPDLPASASAFFRDLDRRLSRIEMLFSHLPVPHGPTLPPASERANQLFVLEGTIAILYYSTGTAWQAL